MKSKILMSLLVIVVSISMMVSVTMAWFTDTETNTNNSFATGTLNVDLNGDGNVIDLGVIGNMAPGDTTGTATLEISNPGTLNLAWFGKFVITGNDILKDVVYINFAQMEFLNPTTGNWEPTDNFIDNGVGAGPYPTYYNTLVDPFTGKITLKNWEGNSSMAPGSGYEFMGALKPGYKYRLTFNLGFSEKTEGAQYMGKNLNIAFKVDAAQIKAEALNSLKSGLGNHVTWLNNQIAKQP